MDILDRQFIYIVGAERSGTTWLMNMVGQHQAVASNSPRELTVFFRYLSQLENAWQLENHPKIIGRDKIGLATIITEQEYQEIIYFILRKVYGKIINQKDNISHIMDKSPGYSLHIDLINKYFPSAKFVHLIRDGRDVAVSMVSVKERHGFSRADISSAIDSWKRYVTAARTARKFGANRYLEVRYEKLIKNTAEELANIFKFCGLDGHNVNQIAVDNRISSVQFSFPNPDIDIETRLNNRIWIRQLAIADKYHINSIAGDLLLELGYIKDRQWWYSGNLERYIFFTRLFWSKIAKRLEVTFKIFLRGEL